MELALILVVLAWTLTAWKLFEHRETFEPSKKFKRGDRVKKKGGDYVFNGVILCSTTKRSGKVRLLAEDDRGIIHVFSEANLEKLS